MRLKSIRSALLAAAACVVAIQPAMGDLTRYSDHKCNPSLTGCDPEQGMICELEETEVGGQMVIICTDYTP